MLKYIPNSVKNFFGYTKSEYRAVLLITPLMVILIIFQGTILNIVFPKKDDISHITIKLDSMLAMKSTSSILESNSNTNIEIGDKAQTNSSFSSNNILKSSKKHFNSNKKQNIRIDINHADSTELKKVYGIGNVLANRIIKYRNILGGFSTINQVYEVYGIDTATYLRIKEQFYISENFKPKIMALGTVTQQELAAHPYIDFTQARLIYNYYLQHPNMEDLFELTELPPLDSNFIYRLTPYLKLNPPDEGTP